MPRLIVGCRSVIAAAALALAAACGDGAAALCAAPGVAVRDHGGSCSDGPAASAMAGARDARDALPPDLRPALLVVELDPRLPAGATPVDVIQTDRATGRIFVDSRAVARIDRAMWLHELVHVVAGSRRPPPGPGRRVIAAVDEAVADYVAAALLDSPRLGDRDLAAPDEPLAWEALALPGARFDEHRAGRQLAARLWQRRPPWRSALACARTARYPTAARTPRAALAAWLTACPPRDRASIEAAVRTWLPPELY